MALGAIMAQFEYREEVGASTFPVAGVSGVDSYAKSVGRLEGCLW